MESLQHLFDQKAALERQIADAQRTMRADAIAKVRALMTEYGLTVEDLATKSTRGPKPSVDGSKKVAAKYRDPATGNTWSGRGLKPKWLATALEAGKSLTDFAV